MIRLLHISGVPRDGGPRAARIAGTNNKLATSVLARLINSKSPILAVPGWRDRAREPKAVPVVSAEKTTARVVAEPSGAMRPILQFMTK